MKRKTKQNRVTWTYDAWIGIDMKTSIALFESLATSRDECIHKCWLAGKTEHRAVKIHREEHAAAPIIWRLLGLPQL